ncbi:nitrogenase cofactor biosynthesis protein NifB [Desulfosarcina widdelii]|uniref:FeMo cofactor biosynthesis protein NifB n=1 Tax=Desulfosarcina widdelii TaxID=947919 RepID=A0A5K7Z7I0_9BACT|nr:radical SAM protein [Desulfosarcina widdelii]BBO75671.1 nitrogenase cofactor biosynthesis protein NifB [Desulfosarcina widdelii]
MNIEHHPCFNAKMRGKYGRVHLPVAPRCNIQCNYCDRKYDCVNESRPGVTSAVLTPHQAMAYLEYVLEEVKNISVVGIAGPGDPFANPDETMETLRLTRKRYPEMILCLATNGLGIGPYIDELAELNVSHVTITLNAIDSEIGSQLYAFVRHGKKVLGPRAGFDVLLEKQLEAIIRLKEKNVTTKVNTIIVPGVNETHIESVAEKMADLRVDILNCIPFYPNAGAKFANLEEPSKEVVTAIRKKAARHIPQMYHCKRCRADAVGIMGQENGCAVNEKLQECAQLPEILGETRPYVAVASLEGVLVNQKLGKAEELLIYGRRDDGEIYFVEARKTPEPGGGLQRWEDLGKLLSDCRALMVAGIGDNPRRVLSKKKIDILELDGMIEEAAEAVFEGYSMNFMVRRDIEACNKQHPMAGMGCM